jgi:hypothetical protein
VAARRGPAQTQGPKLAALMDHAETDVLAYMSFPPQHRTRLHSIKGDTPTPVALSRASRHRAERSVDAFDHVARDPKHQMGSGPSLDRHD